MPPTKWAECHINIDGITVIYDPAIEKKIHGGKCAYFALNDKGEAILLNPKPGVKITAGSTSPLWYYSTQTEAP